MNPASQASVALTSQWVRRSRKFSWIAILIICMISILVLLGWWWNIDLLKQAYLGHGFTMKPNTAWGLLLSSLALGLRQPTMTSQSKRLKACRHSLRCLLALVVMVLGLLTLSEYFWNWNLGIDQLLIHNSSREATLPHPGRMGQATAVNFVLIGMALLILQSSRRCRYWLAQTLAGLAGLIALTVLIGHLFGVASFYDFLVRSTYTASHTACAFVLLSLSILCTHPQQGFMKVLTHERLGGVMARRLLPWATALPLLLGYLVLQGSQAGRYDLTFGLALLVISAIIGLSSLIWSNAAHLNRLDSQRQRIMAALQQSENRFRQLVEQCPFPIQMLQPDGTTFYLNAAWEALWQLNRKQTYGFNPLQNPQVSAWGQLPDWQRAMAGHTVQFPPFLFDPVPLYAGGQPRWVEMTLYPIKNDQEEVQELVLIQRDISERIDFQQQLQASNFNLEQANKTKDAFLQMMSHELRTPLNPILGMAEGLQAELFGSLNERQKKAASLIVNNGQHLLKIVNNILELVSLETGKAVLNRQPVIVKDLCTASLAMVAPQAEAKAIHLESHVLPGLGLVQVDGERIRQVLVQLLENAVKFTPEGGAVSLEVQQEPAKDSQSQLLSDSPPVCDSYIQFWIRDSGIGIAAESLDKLFQPFVQLDDQLSRRYEGTGLGLALVRKLVELQGGCVSVESQPEQGSCFTVKIPL